MARISINRRQLAQLEHEFAAKFVFSIFAIQQIGSVGVTISDAPVKGDPYTLCVQVTAQDVVVLKEQMPRGENAEVYLAV